MSTHNIGFRGELTKIFFNYHKIYTLAFLFDIQFKKGVFKVGKVVIFCANHALYTPTGK